MRAEEFAKGAHNFNPGLEVDPDQRVQLSLLPQAGEKGLPVVMIDGPALALDIVLLLRGRQVFVSENSLELGDGNDQAPQFSIHLITVLLVNSPVILQTGAFPLGESGDLDL